MVSVPDSLRKTQQMKLEEFFIVIVVATFSLLSSCFALLNHVAAETIAFQVSQEDGEVIQQSVVVMENAILRLACTIGSLLGALLSILLFPTKSETGGVREIAAKFLAASVAGVLFTPILMRSMAITIDLDHLIAMSGFIAFTSVTVLHKSIPLLETTVGDWFVKFFERVFGK